MARDEDADDRLQYRVVHAEAVEDLERRVERLLDKGWSLQGGVSTCTECYAGGLSRIFLYQAMTRRIS